MAKKTIRLLFLALQEQDRAPAQRYRVEAFLPYLKANGLEVEYAHILDSSDTKDFYGTGSAFQKAKVVSRAFARRVRSLAPLFAKSCPDVVLVQREAFFLGGPWAERIAALRAPIIFDFDDAIWLHVVSEGNRRFGFLKNVTKIPTLLHLAQTVIAGNEHLANYARQHARRVVVVPTCVDTDRYTPAPNRARPEVVLGWSGSPATMPHFTVALPALERIKAKYGGRVGFRVVGDPTFRHDKLQIVGKPWSSKTEVQDLREMDVGLMPLPDDEYAKGKCGLKGLTYMAVGIPAVMSPVGVNSALIRDGVNGFLPRTTEEWVFRLSQLIDDNALRSRMGQAARDRVVQNYSVARWRETLLQIVQEAAESHQRAPAL